MIPSVAPGEEEREEGRRRESIWICEMTRTWRQMCCWRTARVCVMSPLLLSFLARPLGGGGRKEGLLVQHPSFFSSSSSFLLSISSVVGRLCYPLFPLTSQKEEKKQ